MYNKSTVTSQPRLSQSPPEPRQLVEAGGGTIPSLLCYKKMCAQELAKCGDPREEGPWRESTTDITKQTKGLEGGPK